MKSTSCKTAIFLNRVTDFKNAVIARGGIFADKDFSIGCYNNIVDIIDISVRLAYRDIQRVFKGIGAYQAEKLNMLDYVKAELREYFNSSPKTQAEFNEWHEKVCTDMKGYLATYRPAGRAGFTYGCAQKILNLSFKYLYCFDYFEVEPKEYMPYFEFCHITFDNKILRWAGYKISVTSIDDYSEYMKMQVAAQAKPLTAPWDTCSPLCPLEKEFIVW